MKITVIVICLALLAACGAWISRKEKNNQVASYRNSEPISTGKTKLYGG
jgi:hypothetical protein